MHVEVARGGLDLSVGQGEIHARLVRVTIVLQQLEERDARLTYHLLSRTLEIQYRIARLWVCVLTFQYLWKLDLG